MRLVLCLVGSFLVGSIPTGYLAARLLKGIDIRKFGSGNVGATNVFRTLGKEAGVAVLAIDFMKGYLPVTVLTSVLGMPLAHEEWALSTGITAVLGHVFTPFLGFKGGKGIATGSGMLCGGFPILFIIALIIWALVFGITRIVSISSLISVLSLPIGAFLTGQSATVTAAFALLSGLIFWSHRENITRLRHGGEHPVINR